MREELTKLERYQKQFHFLYENGIETDSQLADYQAKQENKINDLTQCRKDLYNERNVAGEQKKGEISQKISSINQQLKACRREVSICQKIFVDAKHIKEKRNQIQELQTQTVKKEAIKHEYKRRSR